MRRQTSNVIINIGWMMIAVLLINVYFLGIDHWIHWFGLIGFGMVGWFWRKDE